MYHEYWQSLKQGWILILVFSLLIEGLPRILGDGNGATGGTVVAYALYAYYIHRFLLLDEAISNWKATKPTQQHRMGRFILVSGLFVVVAVAIAFIATFQLTSGLDDDRFLGVFLVLTLTANLVVLALFGTALPAAAIGDTFGPTATLARMRPTFLRIFGGLLLGPGLVGAVGVALILFVENALASQGPVSDTLSFGIGLAARALGFVNTTFAVVVLCRAYLSVTPVPPVQAVA